MKGLRSGYTTGTCAAAAARAAARCLLGEDGVGRSAVELPDGERVSLPVLFTERGDGWAMAGVRKNAGDDPDDTDGVVVTARISWSEQPGVCFSGGEGVGTVTRPGLSVPVGEPAINPVPHCMIERAIREVTDGNVRVTVSIPGGQAIAPKTFNPRLGIQGGLSVLGTSGRVVPFSCPAVRESLALLLRVGVAAGVSHPVLVPGNIGARAAERHFRFEPDALISVSNEWGYLLQEAATLGVSGLLAVGHPGKLAKLIDGHFQTHSRKSPPALPIVLRFARSLSLEIPDGIPTVQGCFEALGPDESQDLAAALAGAIRERIAERLGPGRDPSVAVIDMQGALLATDGDLSPWT